MPTSSQRVSSKTDTGHRTNRPTPIETDPNTTSNSNSKQPSSASSSSSSNSKSSKRRGKKVSSSSSTPPTAYPSSSLSGSASMMSMSLSSTNKQQQQQQKKKYSNSFEQKQQDDDIADRHDRHDRPYSTNSRISNTSTYKGTTPTTATSSSTKSRGRDTPPPPPPYTKNSRNNTQESRSDSHSKSDSKSDSNDNTNQNDSNNSNNSNNGNGRGSTPKSKRSPVKHISKRFHFGSKKNKNKNQKTIPGMIDIDEEDKNNNNNNNSNKKNKEESTKILDEFSALMTKEFPSKDPKSSALHIACAKHYSDALIIDHLLKQGPDALSKENSNQELPLHCAMRDSKGGGVSDKVVDSLLYLHPNGVNHANIHGCLPIHIACHQSAPSIYAIRRLVVENENSLMVKCKLVLPFDPMSKTYMKSIRSVRGDAPFSLSDDAYTNNGTGVGNGNGKGNLIHDDTVQNETNHGSCLWNVLTSMSPSPKNSFDEVNASSSSDVPLNLNPTGSNSDDEHNTETDFTPLHLAVLSGAEPDVVEFILNTNLECLNLTTSQGRKAIECAKYAVINQLVFDESMSTKIKNVFAAIEILQTFEVNQKKKDELLNFISSRSFKMDMNMNRSNLSMSAHTSPNNNNNINMNNSHHQLDSTLSAIDTNEESVTFDNKKEWRKLNVGIQFTRHLRSSLSLRSPLGPYVSLDEECVDVNSQDYKNFTSPPKLAHLCINIELPVGFRRLRWAMLNSRSTFLTNELQRQKLKHSEIQVEPWDLYEDYIGGIENPDNIDNTDFIGCERKCQYTVPKSGLVKANMAYENITIVEYNDFCFAIKKVTTNPDVPFGSTFECHTLMVFTNLGMNNCQLEASVEARFVGKPPMIAWKIKNGMYSGVTDFFVAKGEVICDHANY